MNLVELTNAGGLPNFRTRSVIRFPHPAALKRGLPQVGNEWRCRIDATSKANLLQILGYFPIEVGNSTLKVQFGKEAFAAKATARPT